MKHEQINRPENFEANWGGGVCANMTCFNV